VNDPAKILVVDDEDAGRFVKLQTLRRAGFTVFEASTGGEGLKLAASEHPDLVVLDVNLPDISGLEVARRLRASADMPVAPQILQVSNTAVTPADRVRGLEHGADVYLTEPVGGGVLVATVHALLRVRRAETALAAALDGERAARQIAEQASRLKDEFLATLSHELRTPLNALMGWIWQLRHTSLTDEARERALDSLERNARMQAQLINDLLDVSRASKGKLQLEMRFVDLKEVVAAALEFVKESVENQHLRVDADLTSVWVAGDLARLQQIAANLLTNAVQFTPQNGRIAISLGAEGNDAVFRIQDTGAGIDAAFLPYVFDQFRQGEGGLSRKHSGLGLGLAVVKQLIDLHNGTVTVTSAGLGHGATFTVRLPRVTAAPPNDATGLLLQDVRIRLESREHADTTTLKSALESSGAQVSSPGAEDADAEAEVDLVVIDTGGVGSLTLRFPGTQNVAQTIPRSAVASDIVRRIARMLVTTRAS
jgi:signal transduction histidine kinase